MPVPRYPTLCSIWRVRQCARTVRPAADLPEVPTPGYAILVYDLNAQAPVCENKEVQLHMVKVNFKRLRAL